MPQLSIPTTILLILSVLIHMTHALSSSPKLIYNIPGSGWTSPQWNWGYAVGTGHDCARICRQQYATRAARVALLQNIATEPENLEEIKLILALAWQKGRWDGTDGGVGGYGQVLEALATANRYESSNNQQLLFLDMQEKFHVLNPSDDLQKKMNALSELEDVDLATRRCSALVLEAMGFIENGL
jgi:hypothetical protein